MRSIRGGCHCGGVRVEFATATDLAMLHPRVCDCSFCSRHGAAWLSDVDGRLVIAESRAGALRDYRQGSGSARFLFCGNCGVCVAVVYETDGRRFGAVDAGCLEAGAGFGNPVPASPRTLSVAEKVARWKAMWVADVVVTRAEA